MQLKGFACGSSARCSRSVRCSRLRRCRYCNDADDSDLQLQPSRKRGRRSISVGRASTNQTASAGRRPSKESAPSAPADDAEPAEEELLLSPQASDKVKVKGRVGANGLVVSAKDGRILSKHLGLKQAFSHGYRNPHNTNT